jgi:hypothetical protein
MKKNCEKATAHSQIFYMGIFCITLKEINTKRFAKHWHSPMLLWQNGHDFFFFICYAVGLLQYSKSVWSKVGTNLYFNASKLYQKWKKVAKCTRYLQFSKFRCTFSIFPNKMKYELHYEWKFVLRSIYCIIEVVTETSKETQRFRQYF